VERIEGICMGAEVARLISESGPEQPPLRGEERPKGALRQVVSIMDVAVYQTTFTLHNAANFMREAERQASIAVLHGTSRRRRW